MNCIIIFHVIPAPMGVYKWRVNVGNLNVDIFDVVMVVICLFWVLKC